MQHQVRMIDERGNELLTTSALAQRLNYSYCNVYARYKYHGHCRGYVPSKIDRTLYWKKIEETQLAIS